MARNFSVHSLGLVPYETMLFKMSHFTKSRTENTVDEIWLCEHSEVFTLGQAGKSEHILNAQHIPIVKSDRGGQVTYHGPGFLMFYCLWDLARLNLNVRQWVIGLENMVISWLKDLGIEALGKREAPGVYVGQHKIASLGLRIRKGCSYHGLCLNVGGDVRPFSFINPCGIPGQPITSLAELGLHFSCEEAGLALVEKAREWRAVLCRI